MEITEIRIKLMADPNDRLQAFCSVTLDGCFVIRDLKIIQGLKGSFVAMPSRKLMDRCPKCFSKNHLRARFCNDCGCLLHQERALKADDGRAKLYADIAHPINSDCREQVQHRVLEAYAGELERSKLPGYVCLYDDYGEDNYATAAEDLEPLAPPQPIPAQTGSRRFDLGQLSGTAPAQALSNGTYGDPLPRRSAYAACAQERPSDDEGFGSGL